MLDAYTTPAGKRAASLSSARDLSSLIFSEAGAAKEQGFVTDPVTDALRQTRLFWMMLPVEVGGGDMLAALDAIRGRPDASLDMQLRAHVNGGPSRLRGERATVRRDPARNGGLS